MWKVKSEVSPLQNTVRISAMPCVLAVMARLLHSRHVSTRGFCHLARLAGANSLRVCEISADAKRKRARLDEFRGG